MESLFPAFSIWVIVGLALCAIVLVATAGLSIFMFIFKAGVVINEAQKPAHMDAGDYRLDQGREVRAEGTIRRSPDTPER